MAGSDIRPAVLAALLAACMVGGGAGVPAAAEPLNQTTAAEPLNHTAPAADPAALIPQLESALGRPLTPDEQMRCLDAARRVLAASREQQLVSVHELASLFGVAPERLATDLPPPGPRGTDQTALLVSKIQELLARPLDPTELEQVTAIEQAHRIAVEPARAAFAYETAAVIGLTPESIYALLSEVGP